jgi:outer membrane immunogenic protein
MRTRWFQAVAVAAVLTAGATVSSPALSADPYGAAPYYDAAPVPPQDVFEGWYLGGTVGGSWVSYDLAPVSPGSVDSSGVLGGVIGGYSWQRGPFVIGVEGDFMAADISGDNSFNGDLNKVSPGFDTMADVRLRAGYAILPNLLLFGTFGGAWADADLPINGPGGAFRENTFFGWSAGGGAEYAFDQNWSARLDYQFTDFGSETISYPGGKVTYDPDANTFRGSVIYRF